MAEIAKASKIYICDKCHYQTHLLDSYKKHCKTGLHKTGKRKPRSDKLADNYKCDKCNYLTTAKLNLKTHVLNNHSSKEERKCGFKYYCEKCDLGVFTATSFKNHTETQKHKSKTV